jgi:hypothetical protein
MAAGIALMVLFVSLTACRSTFLEQARQMVKPGTPRDKAVEILNEYAWYYQPCPNLSSIDDLFFYGSRNYRTTDMLIVTSIMSGTVYVVHGIATFDEPNAWHAAYRDCIRRERFEN